MEEIKLKKCPCCGGEAEVKDIKYKSMPAITWVECKKCGLQTKTFKQSIYYCAKEEAAKVWNRRESDIETCENCGCSCIQTIQEFSFGNPKKTFKKCIECKKLTEVKDEK